MKDFSYNSDPLDLGEAQLIHIDKKGFTHKNLEHILILKISGEMNLYSSQHIKNYVEERLNQDIKNVILDLQEIQYIDSSGLGAFLGLHSKVFKNGGGVYLSRPSPKVQYVLKLTKLEGLLKTYGSIQETLDHIT